KIMEVRPSTRNRLIHLVGILEANREAKVGFKIGGKIKALLFDEGARVERGAPMGRLERAELLARRRKALEQRNKAKRDLDRMERLYRQKSVPKAALQDARSALITIEAEVDIVEDLLKNTVVHAPFSGLVTRKLAEVGEVVPAGGPIAILAETDPILLKAAVSDTLIPRIHKGQSARIRAGCAPGTLFKGRVLRLEPLADPLSRTLRVVIRLDNPGGKLRPGLVARVEIPEGVKAPALWVPLDALFDLGSAPYLFVVKNGKALKRLVRTGDITGPEVEILEGLSPGDQVVIAGGEYLSDGQKVLLVQRGRVPR
ncbi:MAG: efflux RND transporter periplasmic adaptor subunit, partial [Deltaproteobacteria bacterium]|nr:efflux RND transporter periplasmic adaptor subunit [Deltaproteobacteria bacterium]